MSERCILDFFQNFGIEVSFAYISNQWTKGYDDFHQEKAAIFEAGLSSTSYQQIDEMVEFDRMRFEWDRHDSGLNAFQVK